jgi:putative tricarboxylic transport membrane protein
VQLGWKVTSSALTLFFALFAYHAAKLPLFDELGPGPGLFPLVMGAAGLVLSVILFLQVRSGSIDLPDEGAALAPNARMRLLSVIILLGVAALMLEPLGYTIAALIMVPIVLVALGARSVIAIALVSLALSVGVFHVFYHWLGVALPVGLFGI